MTLRLSLRLALAKRGAGKLFYQDGPKYQLGPKKSHDDATYIFGILGICRQTYNQGFLKTKVTTVRYGPSKLVTWRVWGVPGAPLTMVS